MKLHGQIICFALCGIFLLSEVNARGGDVLNRIKDKIQELKSNEMLDDSSKDGSERAIFDIFRPRPVPAVPQVAFPVAPPAPPSLAVAVPSNPVIPSATHVHRPGILNLLPPLPTRRPFPGLFGGAASSEEHGVQNPWINYALSKCAKVDPRQISAFFPTAENGLREPKMYYFENSTSSGKTWFGAQDACSAKGMQLVSVNSVEEHNILKAMMVKILAGSTPVADAAATPNPATFWIGLNNLDTVLPHTYIGDSTATYVEWHAAEPGAAPNGCVAYTQFTSNDNIKMDAKDCTATTTFRFICELTDECTALLMSRYPTHHHLHHGIQVIHHGK